MSAHTLLMTVEQLTKSNSATLARTISPIAECSQHEAIFPFSATAAPQPALAGIDFRLEPGVGGILSIKVVGCDCAASPITYCR